MNQPASLLGPRPPPLAGGGECCERSEKHSGEGASAASALPQSSHASPVRIAPSRKGRGTSRTLISIFSAIAACGAIFAATIAPTRAADVTVFAAASLSDALNEVAADYRRSTGHTAAVSFAASSVLARQIANSQGADIFISADTEWMDYLARRGLLARGTRRNLLGNHLVLIAPADSRLKLTIAPRFDIAGALHGGRLALADPGSVPAGKYAKAALMALGVWTAVSDHLAPAENVRVALAYVARGETPLGIVYTTDARAEPRVRIVDTFPDSTHPPIVYPVTLMKGAKPFARQFLNYLEGPAAAAVFRKDGFVVLSHAR